jgi:DNA-binding GntR family transcriptional regulator
VLVTVGNVLLLHVVQVRAGRREPGRPRVDAQAVRLRELLTRRNAAYTANWHDYRQADLALREQIADAAGNALLADLYPGPDQDLARQQGRPGR